MKPPFKPRSPSGKSAFGKKAFGKYDKPPPPRKTGPQNDTERMLAYNPENDLIYGAHPVAAALQNDKRRIIKLWATENGVLRLREEIGDLKIEPELVHPRLLDHLLKSKDAVHQGMILEAKPLRQPNLDQIDRDGLVLVLDQVTDPHNVGAIMRSAVAFGATAIVTTTRGAAETNGAFFKAASGAYEWLPYVTVTNLARALDELKSYGFTTIGLDSDAEQNMDEVKISRPLALVLGAEGKGLRQLTRETCDIVARLDMPGKIKSLNVSIAAAVSLYALRGK
jgi:23S rRNA (guanosine2251-2'-O)-methyltransferase